MLPAAFGASRSASHTCRSLSCGLSAAHLPEIRPDHRALGSTLSRYSTVTTCFGGFGLREDEDLDWDSATDDNRVKTAVSWLEDVVLLIREENYVQIFPSLLRVMSLQEAQAKLREGIRPTTHTV